MNYIIASTGRCASTTIAEVVAQAVGTPQRYFQDFAKVKGDKNVIKTHNHFRVEPPYPYRAIYIYGDLGDATASIFHSNPYALNNHLRHLTVPLGQRLVFFCLSLINRTKAFSYLVHKDKFRYLENIKSWKSAKSVLFVRYEELCAQPDKMLNEMRRFLNLELPAFRIEKRKNSISQLPPDLQSLIRSVYDSSIGTT